MTIRGREIGVFNLDGAFYALVNRCPHQGAALCTGAVVSRLEAPLPGEYRLAQAGAMLRCPGTAGNSTSAPGNPGAIRTTSRRAPTMFRSSRGGPGQGPFAAETVSVAVEQEYVVVEL
ncbi:Rieske 2Fe-2S domain-containing protein [Siccirubricoccus deserti]